MTKKRATKAPGFQAVRTALLTLLVAAFAISPVLVAAPRLFGGDLAAAPIAPAEQPGVEQPGAEQPGAEQPGAEQPGAEQPGAEQPGTGAGTPGGNLPPELRECAAPSIQFVVIERMGDFRMKVNVRINGITTPGKIRVDAKNSRQYLDQKFEAEGASTREVVYDVTFGDAADPVSGRQSIDVTVTDACGRVYTDSFLVATPFAGFTDAVSCPGTIDANGYCIVNRATPVSLVIPGGSGSWTWDDGEVSTGTRARLFDEKLLLVFAQARSFDGGEMRVTPVLPFALATASKPRIREFVVPDIVAPYEPFTVTFTKPEGADEAEPSIWVDDRQVTIGLTAELRLEPGIHTVAFVLAWPDNGGIVSRQAAIIVPERPEAFGLIARLWANPAGQLLLAGVGGILGSLSLLGIVLGIRMGYRRFRGLLDGPISPFQAYRLLEQGGVTVTGVERISRRRYRFSIRCADGRTDTLTVEATSLRYAWEALISALVRRGC
jgi:hypothetical protein